MLLCVNLPTLNCTILRIFALYNRTCKNLKVFKNERFWKYLNVKNDTTNNLHPRKL